MRTALITGARGLVGGAVMRRFTRDGYDVTGLDCEARRAFLGETASRSRSASIDILNIDLRNEGAVQRLLATRPAFDVVVHAAAQPSHPLSVSFPRQDFDSNALATSILLDAVRTRCVDTTFLYCSSNKVYGDWVNRLPLEVRGNRLELADDHPSWAGITETAPVDKSIHTPFGVSKLAADMLVQEYGHTYEMPTASVRFGCITGAGHGGVPFHGFLSYLARCYVEEETYSIIGFHGYQVRDIIHASDVAHAFSLMAHSPRVAAVYNLGGGRGRECSVLEAIAAFERVGGTEMKVALSKEKPRIGDHRWWVTDVAGFRTDYPCWQPTVTLDEVFHELYVDAKGMT